MFRVFYRQISVGGRFVLEAEPGCWQEDFPLAAKRDFKLPGRNSRPDLAEYCGWLSYNAVADLMLARRSSMSSRSTSQ